MSSAMYDAVYFDGTSAQAQTLEVEVDRAARVVRIGDVLWAFDDIREVPGQAHDALVALSNVNDPLARLMLNDRSTLALFAKRHVRPKVTNLKALFAWAGAAVASVALIIFVLVPVMADQLAEFVPPEGEKALGDVTLNQIRTALTETDAPVQFCEALEGQAALTKMQERLIAKTAVPGGLTVHVLDHEMVNAFALPGGNIVFFRGLIEAAETSEQVAAVFAHEIGHVVSRDPTRHALRSAGSIGVLGLLLGDFAGGAVVLVLTNRLIEAQYSQGAEAQADEFAHAAMRKADLKPSALGEMFETFRSLGGEPDGIVAHFLSHPELGDRIAAADRATPPGFSARSLLTQDEWRALQGICD